MPRVTEQNVRAGTFCPDALCPGNAIETVDAIKQTVDFTYNDAENKALTDRSSPLGPYTEHSVDYLRFADQADAECKVCGRTRELTPDVKRPIYQAQIFDSRTGQPLDQLALLKLKADGKIVQPGEQTAEQAAQGDELAALRAQNELLTRLLGQRDPEPDPPKPTTRKAA